MYLFSGPGWYGAEFFASDPMRPWEVLIIVRYIFLFMNCPVIPIYSSLFSYASSSELCVSKFKETNRDITSEKAHLQRQVCTMKAYTWETMASVLENPIHWRGFLDGVHFGLTSRFSLCPASYTTYQILFNYETMQVEAENYNLTLNSQDSNMPRVGDAKSEELCS